MLTERAKHCLSSREGGRDWDSSRKMDGDRQWQSKSDSALFSVVTPRAGSWTRWFWRLLCATVVAADRDGAIAGQSHMGRGGMSGWESQRVTGRLLSGFSDDITVDTCVCVCVYASCQRPRRLHERRDVSVAVRPSESTEPDNAGWWRRRQQRRNAGRRWRRRSLRSTLLSQRKEVTPPTIWPSPIFCTWFLNKQCFLTPFKSIFGGDGHFQFFFPPSLFAWCNDFPLRVVLVVRLHQWTLLYPIHYSPPRADGPNQLVYSTTQFVLQAFLIIFFRLLLFSF